MKHKFISSLAGLAMVGTMLMPVISTAQTATNTAQINSISALLQQIQALQSQIDALKTSQKTLQTQASTEFSAFVNTLSLGSRGDAVIALQALLAANPNIYPEGLITGYFGKATENALKRLQKENGLEQAGRVGPKTISLLNKLLKENRIAFEDEDDDDDDDKNRNVSTTNRGKKPCAIVPPGHLIAPGWLKKNGDRPTVPPCQVLPKGIEKKGDDWKPGTTTPYTAPMINSISNTLVSSTTATITWTTNKETKSTLWYSTATPINIGTATKIEHNNYGVVHTQNLTGLMASTTYYYVIKVTDNKNNSATSTERTLTTTLN